MARDTDRKKISEAVRLSKDWFVAEFVYNGVKLERGPEYDEALNVFYGATSGRITYATYYCHSKGIVEPLTAGKRERVLAIIEGRS